MNRPSQLLRAGNLSALVRRKAERDVARFDAGLMLGVDDADVRSAVPA